jgi:mono/diheme cytochrome c family protein
MTRFRLAIVAALIVASFVIAWIIYVPGPLDFARGSTVELEDYKGANPTGVPPALSQTSVVDRGEYLARAADCEACHTAKDGVPYAGGLAFNLPFGTLYSPNITPDKETGIGSWTDANFLNAIHRGIAPDGTRLYPAFPYASYTQMTESDALAIKAFLFSLKPIHRETPGNSLSFPFNQRWLMRVWSMFYNSDSRFRPNREQSAEWNRGAYLAEALGHCGECHTPRNLLQALNNRKKFAGAVTAGWEAYNITQDEASGIGKWSVETTAKYLAFGHAEGFGTASGPMGEAVDKSLMHLEADDIKALVVYLRTIPSISDPSLPGPKTTLVSVSPKAGSPSSDKRGAEIFAGACAGCHGWSGQSPVLQFANFVGERSVNDPSARNVAQAVIWGVTRQSPTGPVTMPAFGKAYSNEEIAAVANYVTARFGAAKSNITAEDVAKISQQVSQ